MATYVELHVTTHFSFLRGASGPDELFAAAALLGHAALGVADLSTVAGMVRCWDAQKATGVRLIAGARVVLDDGRDLLLYATDKAAWSRMTRLLTIGKQRAGKGRCQLGWQEIAQHAGGLIAILLPDMPEGKLASDLAELQMVFGKRGYLALSFRRRPDDFARLDGLNTMARAAGVRAVAIGNVLYHSPERRVLQDVLTAIREKRTIDGLGFKRERHADRHLKAPDEMERRFAAFPDAIRATADIAARCTFDLGELSYQYPHERVCGAAALRQKAPERPTSMTPPRIDERDGGGGGAVNPRLPAPPSGGPRIPWPEHRPGGDPAARQPFARPATIAVKFVQLHEKLTIHDISWTNQSLRQGCTLWLSSTATYLCTLSPFSSQEAPHGKPATLREGFVRLGRAKPHGAL